MHESVFTYNISRPYPYRWFTWVVVTGGILATALFSTINFAANGYELGVLTTYDPNNTILEAESRWYYKWSLFQKTSATCQPQSIGMGSQYYTNNSVLAWSVSDAQSRYGNGNLGNRLPSFAYSNNVLQACQVLYVQINFRNASDGNVEKWYVSLFGFVQCNVSTATGLVAVQLAATIQESELGTDQVGFFLPNDAPAEPGQSELHNLWDSDSQTASIWGSFLLESFASAIWTGKFQATHRLSEVFESSCNNNVESVTSPTFITYLNPTLNTSIMSPNFFDYTTEVSPLNICPNFTDPSPTGPILTGSVDTYVDGLAKSFYSLMLTDLGQTDATNLLADPQLIMQMQKTSPQQPYPRLPADIYQNELNFFNSFYAAPIFKTSYSDDLWNSFLPINGTIPVVKPAVISTEYFCQVPQLKSMGSIFSAVIVADLVYLQTLWKVFNLATLFFMTNRHREANRCEGCARELSPSDRFHNSIETLDEVEDERNLVKTKTPSGRELQRRTTLW